MSSNDFFSRNKKTIAREIIFIFIWVIGSYSTHVIVGSFRDEYLNESNSVASSAEASYIYYCTKTYDYLEGKGSWLTAPHTLKSFTREIKNNKEFLKNVYKNICFYDSKFENKHTLAEFSDLINTNTFLYRGKELTSIEKDKIVSAMENKIKVMDDLEFRVFIFGFLLLFPFRAFVYLLIWAYKTLFN
jgi:hypothetical protein